MWRASPTFSLSSLFMETFSPFLNHDFFIWYHYFQQLLLPLIHYHREPEGESVRMISKYWKKSDGEDNFVSDFPHFLHHQHLPHRVCEELQEEKRWGMRNSFEHRLFVLSAASNKKRKQRLEEYIFKHSSPLSPSIHLNNHNPQIF